jgi:hypothetical protein
MAKFIFVVLKMPTRSAKLLIFAKLVLDSMSGNPRFPNPSPGLGSLDAAIKAVEDAGKGSATDRLAAEAALRQILNHLADYVQLVVETQVGTVDLTAIQAMVESAGMRLRKVGTHPKAVFAVSYGVVPGTVDLTAPASPKRDPHEWEISTDQHTWTALPGTRKAKTQVTGLPIGVAHYFRHRLNTKDGYTAWSDPVLMIVVK